MHAAVQREEKRSFSKNRPMISLGLRDALPSRGRKERGRLWISGPYPEIGMFFMPHAQNRATNGSLTPSV